MGSIMASPKAILMMLAEVLVIFTTLCQALSYTPNLVIITADDIGVNDVGFNHQGTSKTFTPRLDEYSQHSMALKNYYVMPNGHSTRSALLTAKHPAVTGTQFGMTDATIPFGLDPSYTLLPEYLKKLGYSCHAVGQWDLGFYSRDMLPTNRGYDSFYGSYLSYGNYKTHIAKDEAGHESFDLHDDGNLDKTQDGIFKPELYGDKAVDIINNHNFGKSPLHLYVALQSAQIKSEDYETLCKGEDGRSIIPNIYHRMVQDEQDPVRKCFLALVGAIDEVYGRVMDALKSKLILDNTMVIFTSTSGGPSAGSNVNAASNYPFRGAKLSGYEGGVKGVALVYSDRLGNQRTSHCLFHVSDWIPTFLRLYSEVTGDSISPDAFSPMYGINQYICLFYGGANDRYNVLHFLYGNSISSRQHDYKYIVNTDKKMKTLDEWYSGTTPSCRIHSGRSCDITRQECLYNLKEDECEASNYADTFEYKANIASIKAIIRSFNETVKYTTPSEPDPKGTPASIESGWQPWIDSVNQASAHSCSPLLSITLAVLLTVKYMTNR